VPNAALALSADEVVIEVIDQDGTGDAAGTLVIPTPLTLLDLVKIQTVRANS
jgi:hypothetical protein